MVDGEVKKEECVVGGLGSELKNSRKTMWGEK